MPLGADHRVTAAELPGRSGVVLQRLPETDAEPDPSLGAVNLEKSGFFDFFDFSKSLPTLISHIPRPLGRLGDVPRSLRGCVGSGEAI